MPPKFNIRSISTLSAPVGTAPIQDKKPNAYATMKHGTSNTVHYPPTVSMEIEGTKNKGGRPTKDSIRREKMAQISSTIASLLGVKHTKTTIREYMMGRIAQLNEEKK